MKMRQPADSTEVEHRPKFKWKDRPKGKNDAFFYRLRNMQSLSHWPNRPDEFKLENSQVIQHILSLDPTIDIKRARTLFDHAKRIGVIVFDDEAKLWQGFPLWQSDFTPPPTAESSG